VLQARVRMVALPESVPVARRFVDDALTQWGRETLIEDVGLCVSELSTNATLHSGSRFFELELEQSPETVRLTVLDTGSATADSMTAQSDLTDALLDDQTADDASTTGRGIFIVSALASSWGIDELPEGKRVWAEFADDGDTTYDARPPAVTRRETSPQPAELDPDAWVTVHFLDCPAALLLAHDDNLAEIIRELQLVGSDLDRPHFHRLAGLLAGHVQRHAVNWDPARIMAMDAIRDGHERADIHVLSPRHVTEEIAFLRSLVGEAEALAEAGKLMTMPARAEIQQLRDWLEAEFLNQVELGQPPVPYGVWLEQH